MAFPVILGFFTLLKKKSAIKSNHNLQQFMAKKQHQNVINHFAQIDQ